MRIPTTKGTCARCGHAGTRARLRQHLAQCREPVNESPAPTRRHVAGGPALLIEVVGRPKAHWLFLGVAANATLTDVDAALRAIWLECCGHLSEFVVGRTRYTSEPPDRAFAAFSSGPRPQSMRVPAGDVFRPGAPVEHLYDFGSTTILDLSAVGPLPVALPSRTVVLLANNESPRFVCSSCQRPAVSVCLACDGPGGEGFFCETCGVAHACGEEMLRPVANSPRMGICGYTGPGAPSARRRPATS